MLENLSIKNVALIESAEIDFENSLNVLTGETGAGKSILLDAIGLLLGDRADKTLIGRYADNCKVVGRFTVEDKTSAIFKQYCEKYDLEYQDEILISRVLSNDGKNNIKINGETVTLSMLKELCANLVNTYGQNENVTVFDESSHLKILDAFAKTAESTEFIEYVKKYNELKQTQKELDGFGGSDEERLREIDLILFQIKEIESAKISANDYEDLLNTRHKMLNLGKIVNNTILAQNCLNDEISLNISRAKNAIEQASLYDESLADISNRLESLQIEFADIADTVKTYNQDCDFSETEQQKIEDRYALYTKLMRKYGASPEDILEELSSLKSRLASLQNADERITQLNMQKQNITSALRDLAKKIHNHRVKKGNELCDLITFALKNLNMKNAMLTFEFETDFDKLYADGCDRAMLLFSANMGEEPKPLSKIASGGEISRFMLALKSVVADVDNMPTMIFDEIDTGISGATSEAVAKQMAIIGKNHQVIVVTHSAQITAMADTNFYIEKCEQDNKTKTIVTKLDDEQKIIEVARFLSGEKPNDVAIQNAKILIDEQNEYKSNIK